MLPGAPFPGLTWLPLLQLICPRLKFLFACVSLVISVLLTLISHVASLDDASPLALLSNKAYVFIVIKVNIDTDIKHIIINNIFLFIYLLF